MANEDAHTLMQTSVPFTIRLADKSVFTAERVVRCIPRKRLVVFGVWNNKAVVAKLFFNKYRAYRQMQQDVKGVRLLQQQRIPTPALLFEGTDEDKRIQILLFEKIEANNLDELWKSQAHPDDIWKALEAVTLELATQHVFGITQRDLHFKNFLLTDKVVYTLDGAQIESENTILTKQKSLENLALFFSQLGVNHENLQSKLYMHYARARGWPLNVDDINLLHLEIKRWNDERWHRYAKKIMRNCTSYKRISTLTKQGMYDRRYETPEFLAFLDNPDAVFGSDANVMFKNGHSSTVIKVTLDNRELVIKRYNIKNLLHRLRRMFRVSRACKSWRLANKLDLFGVSTAKPVAYIESNIAGLRGRSYFVMEYVSGDNVTEMMNKRVQDNEPTYDIVQRVVATLKNLAKLDITHGDLKATNILINSHDEPVLIDLDGAVEHMSLTGLRVAWKKEVKRFLRNFTNMPEIMRQFAERL